MARVDKTESAVGVVRAVLNADWADDHLDSVYGVGLNSTGKIVLGAGQTGIIGVVNPSKFAAKAGLPTDIFVLADIEDIGDGDNDPTLDAGKKVYAHNTTGVLSHTAASGTYVGFTVEADRLILEMGGGLSGGTTGVTPTAAPAAAAVPFASLTDAANSFNSLRTALITAGVLS